MGTDVLVCLHMGGVHVLVCFAYGWGVIANGVCVGGWVVYLTSWSMVVYKSCVSLCLHMGTHMGGDIQCTQVYVCTSNRYCFFHDTVHHGNKNLLVH